MPVTGDFAELAALEAKFEELASGSSRSALSQGMADAYSSFMQSTVGSGKGPNGESWAPLSSGAKATLGSVAKAACKAVPSSDGISVSVPQPYADVHQKGATITAKGKRLAFRSYTGKMVYAKSVTIPARPFELTSIPSELEAAFDAKGEAVLTKILGK